jgi:hypothetical protein
MVRSRRRRSSVGPVSPGWRDDRAAQEPQQFRDGDWDQFGAKLRAGVVLALQGGGGQVDVGEQADRGPAVPGLPADDLPGIQGGGQLLLQIRGAVTEYERTLITERMRRGRQARLRAGTLLPWTRPPFGCRLDPKRPRDAAGVRVEPMSQIRLTCINSLTVTNYSCRTGPS